MKLKIIIAFAAFLMFSFYSNAQSKWKKCYKWEPGLPIQFQPIPISGKVKACGGSIIDFSIRFLDYDDAICPSGRFKLQFYPVEHKITFKTNSKLATFSNGSQEMRVSYLTQYYINNKYVKGEQVVLVFSKNASLKIDDNWDGSKPIRVTVEIEDKRNPQLPKCHTGNPTDPTAKYTWTISPPKTLPEKLERTDDDPKENTWTIAPADFTYQAKPKSPPEYEGIVIRETFSHPLSGGIFEKSDLKKKWLMEHDMVKTADQAAMEIFRDPNPNAFILNHENKFEDTHGGFAWKSKYKVSEVFKASAIKKKKVGYKLNQQYSCCSNLLGTAEIFRRLNSDGDIYGEVEVKKKHKL